MFGRRQRRLWQPVCSWQGRASTDYIPGPRVPANPLPGGRLNRTRDVMVLACALAAGMAVTGCGPKVDQVLAARDQVDSLAAHALSDFERHPRFAVGRGIALESRRRHIGLSRDLEGAWVAEEIACRVDDASDPREFVLRFSGVAARTDSGWKFLVLHYSRPLELGTAVRLAAADSLHVPLVLAGATPGRREREVLKQFERA